MLLYEKAGNIGILTINRPEALNALNSALLDCLYEKVTEIAHDTELRCLIVTGAGKAFVAGADFSEMKDLSSSEAFAFGMHGHKAFCALENLAVPVIAAVNGYALGGGCELSMSCDIRLASENAVFGQPETGLGITPGFGGTQRLARIIPVGKAKEMLYAGTKIKADEALSLGLVNAVYPQAELMENVMKLANKIAKNAPIAVRNCKKAINDGISLPIEKAVEVEEKLFGDCFETHDQKEGMACFLSREKPKPKAVFTNN